MLMGSVAALDKMWDTIPRPKGLPEDTSDIFVHTPPEPRNDWEEVKLPEDMYGHWWPEIGKFVTIDGDVWVTDDGGYSWREV